VTETAQIDPGFPTGHLCSALLHYERRRAVTRRIDMGWFFILPRFSVIGQRLAGRSAELPDPSPTESQLSCQPKPHDLGDKVLLRAAVTRNDTAKGAKASSSARINERSALINERA
jgi:hypothetical protein